MPRAYYPFLLVIALLLIPLRLAADSLYITSQQGDTQKLDMPVMADNSFSYRLLLKTPSPRKTPLRFSFINARGDSLITTLTPYSGSDPLYSGEGFVITMQCGDDVIQTNAPFSTGRYFKGSPVAFGFEFGTVNEQTLTLTAAGKQVAKIPLSNPPLRNFIDSRLVSIYNPEQSEIERVALSYNPMPEPFTLSPLSDDEIADRLTGSPGWCGEWAVFEYNTDGIHLRPGGSYLLAVIPDESNNSLNIIYLDGAGVNPGRWCRGMLKGKLIPSALSSRYRVIWYDAAGDPLPGGGEAQYTPDKGWNISFPYLDATITLIRTNNELFR